MTGKTVAVLFLAEGAGLLLFGVYSLLRFYPSRVPASAVFGISVGLFSVAVGLWVLRKNGKKSA